jgi:NAD(P)-dependent dehydrogenase (short-subunit alcohol dehydrogenase family)
VWEPAGVPRVAVITGAGSGIGRATAVLLRERGYVVAAFDRDPDGLDGTRRAGSGPIDVATVDVTDAAAVRREVDAVAERHGGLDLLVAAAAVGLPGLVDEQPEHEWHTTVDSILDGTYHCARAAIPHLRRRGGGVIVTFGSVIGRTAIRGFTAYGSAKGGIEALTRGLATDHAADGIRVNCVVPGSTDTPMMWFGLGPDEIEATRQQVLAEAPLGRIADPREIAYAVAWLASDEAAFVTGTSLVVDGGVTARASVTY